MCCGCIPMRVGVIILMVLMSLGLIQIFIDFLKMVTQVVPVLPSLGYGMLAGIVPRGILSIVFIAICAKYLTSKDTSSDRWIVVRAMQVLILYSIVNAVYMGCLINYSY